MNLTRNQKLLIASGCMFVFAVITQTAILPAILKSQVKHKLALKQGWQMRDFWGKVPFPIFFHIYIFNITNPKEIDEGGKPIIQEIGPYVYDEWLEKTNQVDHEEDDTISYNKKSTYYFNAEKSNGLTGDEELLVPNYFLLGLVNTVLIERPALIGVIGKAVDSIFRNPESVFMRAKARDILFDGLIIDCNVEESLGKTVCYEVEKKHEELRLKKLEEHVYSMSLFGPMNATDAKGRLRVYRGLNNIMDVGKVIEYNNKPNISIWKDDYCDTFNGTDGTIFHPFFDETGKDDLVAYNEALCRGISCHYESDTEFADMSTLRYVANIGVDIEENPLHKCYCETPDSCPKKGTYDLYKCIKAPLILTNPHFYKADPIFLNGIDGLQPDKEKHQVVIDLQPLVGAPLHAHTRAQFNMYLKNIPKFKLMKNHTDTLLPLVWIDQELILPDEFIREIKIGLTLFKIAVVLMYIQMLGGLILAGYAGYKHYKSKEHKLEVNPKIKSKQSPKKNTNEIS